MTPFQIHDAIEEDIMENGAPSPDAIIIPEGKQIPAGTYGRNESNIWVRIGDDE